MKAEWQIKSLGQICSFENGDRGENYPSKSVQTTYGVPFINAGHLTDTGIDFDSMNYIPRERFNLLGNGKIRRNDILFCLRGSLGKFASVGDLNEGAIASSLVIVRPSESVLDKFVLAYFQSELCSQMIDKFRNGAAQPNLSAGSLKNFEIPLPPIPEQHRIVAILDEAFDGIATAKANAEKNLQNARALFESHLQSVFSQRGECWVANNKSLSELCELIVDCEHKTAPTQDEGIPSIRTPNIGKGKLLLDGVYRVSDETYKEWTRRAEPQSGDLILAREAPAGNIAVIPENLKVCLGQRTVLIRPDYSVFKSEFLALFLLQPGMQQKLLAHSRGATVKHVNMKDIRALHIESIPPISKQMEIVSVVSNMTEESERLAAIYQQKLAALDELKKSLLHQAFSGQL